MIWSWIVAEEKWSDITHSLIMSNIVQWHSQFASLAEKIIMMVLQLYCIKYSDKIASHCLHQVIGVAVCLTNNVRKGVAKYNSS